MSADTDWIRVVTEGYTFDSPALDLGVLVAEGQPRPEARVRIPLAMLNRHGLVTGATGTGKTKTLQGMAEGLSRAGVPVFAADVKGDLSGLAAPGTPSDKLTARCRAIGQDWQPHGCPVEFYALAGRGAGVPLRATVSSFGPILLSKVLGLNDVQESTLGVVFHWADKQGLPLLDLSDLRAVLAHLSTPQGRRDLADVGAVSPATIGVIQRSLVTLADQGGDDFFGEPEFDTADLVRTTSEGAGVISLLELPDLQDRPDLFSTFLMWLLADLFSDLPEVGDLDRPRLVFFFDEAHLLFRNASRAFLDAIAQTVRLIRSKGVGVVLVTQSPQDVPEEVLGQLGSRIQHQVRAHTPREAKALRSTVETFPTSPYDLAQVLQSVGIGEAVVTVMDPDGAPTPVAWTRMVAPESLMAPVDPATIEAAVTASPLQARYGRAIDRDSAREMLARRLEQAAADHAAPPANQPGGSPGGDRPADHAEQESARGSAAGVIDSIMSSAVVRDIARTASREIVRSLFGTARRRRR